MTDEITQYLIVRTDLAMSPGKVAAQVGHGVQLAMRLVERQVSENPIGIEAMNRAVNLCEWENGDYPKVILGGTKRDFEKLCSIDGITSKMVKVIDNGRTEIPAGSMTCLAFVPMPKSMAKKWVGRLRLYK